MVSQWCAPSNLIMHTRLRSVVLALAFSVCPHSWADLAPLSVSAIRYARAETAASRHSLFWSHQAGVARSIHASVGAG